MTAMTGPDKEYATALFQLAVEESQVEPYAAALKTVGDAVADAPAYLDFLSSPAVPLSERLSAIEEAFGTLPRHVVSFLKLLCEQGHVRALPACITEFEQLVQAQSCRTAAVITSAVLLDESQKQSLCRKLEQMTGKGIDPLYNVDASLLGGVVVEMEGKIYDGSLKHRLHEIKDVMSR